MTAFLKKVSDNINEGCLVNGKLTKAGCTVMMNKAPTNKLVLDFDRPGSPLPGNETRCDYLLAAECEKSHNWIAVLELKNGKLYADQVAKQLQAGASFAQQLVPPRETLKFRPIAISKSVSKHERNKLKNKRIKFHHHQEIIRLISCGESLELR